MPSPQCIATLTGARTSHTTTTTENLIQNFYIALAAIFVLAVSSGAWLPRPAINAMGRKQFRRAMGGNPSADLLPEIRARSRKRGRYIGIGGIVGFGGGLALQLSPALSDSSTPAWPITLLTSLACCISAEGVYALVDAAPHAAPAHRVARVPSPQLADFVPPANTWIARVAAALPAVAVVFLMIASGFELTWPAGLTISMVVAASLSLATGVTLEALSAKLVARAQFASSDWELRWRDSLRSATLRSLNYGILINAFFFFNFLGFIATSIPNQGPLPFIYLFLQLLGAGALLAFAIIDMSAGSDRYFLRRLWTLPPMPAPASAPASASASETLSEHRESHTR